MPFTDGDPRARAAGQRGGVAVRTPRSPSAKSAQNELFQLVAGQLDHFHHCCWVWAWLYDKHPDAFAGEHPVAVVRDTLQRCRHVVPQHEPGTYPPSEFLGEWLDEPRDCGISDVDADPDDPPRTCSRRSCTCGHSGTQVFVGGW